MQQIGSGCLVGTQGNVDPENVGPYVDLLAAIIDQAREDAGIPIYSKYKSGGPTVKEKIEARKFMRWCAQQFT